MMKTSELRAREVINVTDGRRLGLATDLEIDAETGRIRAIVVPGTSRWLSWLGKSDEVVIPWDRIRKIGIDVILVDVGGDNSTEFNYESMF